MTTETEKQGSESAGNHIPLKLGICLLLFSFLIFANTINRYFLSDDFQVLYSVTYHKLPQALLGLDTNLEGRFFRPVPMLSYWIQAKLFGPSPVVFHLTTLLLHAGCAILAANLFYLLFRNLRCAAIFGFVFIVFPNHGEVVNWPANNFTSWATLFYLGTLTLFGYYRLSSRAGFLVLSLFSFLAAAMSKETAFTLPVFLIVFDLFFSWLRGIKPGFGRRVIPYCLFFGLFLLLLLSTRSILNTDVGYSTGEGESLVSLYLSNPFILVADLTEMYLQTWKYLIAPISSAMAYEKQIITVIVGIIGIACVLLLIIRRMRLAAVMYCFLFAAVTLLPLLGTFKIFGVSHWIRFLYMPSVGSCYIIAMILDGALAGIRRASTRYAVLVLAMLPMVCLTKFYDNEWIKAQKENKRLVESTIDELRDYPHYSRVYVSGVPWPRENMPFIGGAFTAAVALYRDPEYIEAYPDFLPEYNVVPIERERVDERDWRYAWLAWDKTAETLTVAGSIQPAKTAEPHSRTWDFGKPQDQRMLEPATNIAGIVAPGSAYPLFMVDGGWAFLKLPVLAPGPPIQYLVLDMMLKGTRTRSDVSRVFWVTERDLDYTGEKSIGFRTTTDGEFHRYRIPLYRNGTTLIDPHIIRFAVRPSQNPGTIFSVRSMTVEYY